MNLIGSNVDPAVRDNLAMKMAETGDDHEHINMIKTRLSKYRRLQKTQYYRALSDLIDPAIRHLECDLAKPRGAFPHTPTDVLQEQRAEWRGMLAVWIQLRDEPHLLEEQVRLFTKQEEEKNKGGDAIGDKTKLDEDKYV